MSGASRFLFDECIGRPVMLQLQKLVAPEAVFAHICELFQQGSKDPDWIPRIAAEGGWVVITSDGGKNSKKGEKLPELCRAHNLTHIILSSKLATKKSTDKAAVIATLWPAVEAVTQEPPGTRFQLRYKAAKGSNILRVELCKVDVEADES